MSIVIQPMETDDEIRGKAYVHWRAWHEAYAGIVSREYLDGLTLEKCEKMAFSTVISAAEMRMTLRR